ncbi:MAG: hypothetical protein ACREBC_00945, partial [Pyrinomonadaceae bacterium]
MPPSTLERLIDRLDEAKRRFGSGQHKQIEQLLARLSRHEFKHADLLIRYHEILLFLRSCPQSPRILQLAEKELASFSQRVERLRDTGSDLSALDDPEVSGIVGTSVTDTFSFAIVRWLLRSHGNQIKFNWDWFEDENRLGSTWPRFIPLLEEDAAVEANVPYVEWLRAVRGRVTEVAWLMKRFESLVLADKERAELYDSLNLYLSWTPSFRATRTGMRLPRRKIFYHRQPLIQRRDVSLPDGLREPPPIFRRLSQKQGEAVLDLTRETSTIRYRELYGFTHGDAKRVLAVNLDRGVEMFLVGLPPARRLPLRAYHAAMIFKNGVPVGYFEGLSLCERMESGFNLYYSFRDGETAWLYARVLNIYHHLLGSTVFTLDPYQIGHENEEGIDSGAFWFYRKLGFRPTRPRLLQLAIGEAKKIASRPSYRTPKKLLRELAAGPMIFELETSRVGDWDSFQVRNLGLAAQRLMARQFGGDAQKMRQESLNKICRMLGVNRDDLGQAELTIWSEFAVMLALIPNLGVWSDHERQALAQIIRAKAGADESRYL